MSPDSKQLPVAEPTEEKAFQTALKLGLTEARELNKAFTDAKSKKWTTSLAFDALRQGDKIQGAKTYEVQIPSEISWGVKVIHACVQEQPSKVFYWIEKGEDGSEALLPGWSKHKAPKGGPDGFPEGEVFYKHVDGSLRTQREKPTQKKALNKYFPKAKDIRDYTLLNSEADFPPDK